MRKLPLQQGTSLALKAADQEVFNPVNDPEHQNTNQVHSKTLMKWHTKRDHFVILFKHLPSPPTHSTLHFQVSWEPSQYFCCGHCSVAKLCSTLCNPVDCSMPGFPVLHYLLKFAQIHVHWVNDATQPSHSLLLSTPFAFNLSQHQGLFQWVRPLHQVAKILELQLQSFQWLFRVRIDWFYLLLSKGLSRFFSSISLKASILHQSAFFMVQLSHPFMTAGKTITLTVWIFAGKVMS